jgi:hypothetical protein
MAPRVRIFSVALVCAAVTALAATASATRFAVIERVFRTTGTWSFEAVEATVRCPVTLEGSFSSGTFAKVAGTRVGSIGRASLGTCSGGTVRVLTEVLPWSMHYSSFTGTLPNTTSTVTQFRGAAFQITPTGLSTCLARSSETSPLLTRFETEVRNSVTGLRLDETASIPLTGGGVCGLFRGRVSGTQAIRAPEGRNPVQMLLWEAEEPLSTTEGARGLPELFINAPAVLGVRSLTNNSLWFDARITAVERIEGNPENFALRQEATEDCRSGKVLLAVRANSCNIRIEHALTPRPEHTTVVITYDWGGAWPWPAGFRLRVTAQ